LTRKLGGASSSVPGLPSSPSSAPPFVAAERDRVPPPHAQVHVRQREEVAPLLLDAADDVLRVADHQRVIGIFLAQDWRSCASVSIFMSPRAMPFFFVPSEQAGVIAEHADAPADAVPVFLEQQLPRQRA
jgi:hypothetical protein